MFIKYNIKNKIKQISTKKRLWLSIISQLFIIVSAFFISAFLSFGGSVFFKQFRVILEIIPVLLFIKIIILWRFKLFRRYWHLVSFPDFIAIFKANLLASVLLFLSAVILYDFSKYGPKIFLLDFLLCFLGLAGFCALARTVHEKANSPFQGQRTLVVGAGSAGQLLVRMIKEDPKLDKALVGFIDDAPDKIGLSFQGLPVLGAIPNTCEIVNNFRVELIIIAIPSALGSQMKRIIAECSKCPVEILTLPSLAELMQGKTADSFTINQLRNVKLEDLLGRKPVFLNNEQIASELTGNVIMVTGAGGSIGSEICRQVAQYAPRTLLLLDRSEFNLYNIDMEFSEKFPHIHLVPIIGDIQDTERIEAIVGFYKPIVIYHAAAYKHVPMMEINPIEAIKNNVLGTRILALTAAKHKVKKFVLISTDKAVHPTNVMGASKRAAELVIQALGNVATIFIAVRFGNVLGSSGSVIPLFEKQIAAGGPVTVTHPEVARYFMTIPEATGLVLQAASMGRGGEIFLLDMGNLVKIYDMAVNMILLSGLEPERDIKIKFTGLRPGEKLREELLIEGEVKYPTNHKKIFVIRPQDMKDYGKIIDDLIAFSLKGNLKEALSCLEELVEGYLASATIPVNCEYPDSERKIVG